MCSHPPSGPNEEPFRLCPHQLFAFTRLYQDRYEAVYRYFYHQTGHVQDAQDLAITTFITAYCRFAQYQAERASLAAWLFGLAHNCLRDYRRRRRPVDPLPPELLDPQPQPDWLLLESERAAALHSAIRKLPDTQRDALGLRFFAGLPSSEVAIVLGKSQEAINMLVYRGIKALRNLLDQEGWR